MKMNNILTRSLTGAIFISIILIPLFFSEIISILVLGLFMSIGIIEFYKLFNKAEFVNTNWVAGLFFSVLSYVIISSILFSLLPLETSYILFPTLYSLIIIEIWRKKTNPLINSASLIFGIIYITLPFILMVSILKIDMQKDNNTIPILAGMFILTWINDTFAYLLGSILGKRKLFKRISPNKTWEGTLSGAFCSIIFGIIIGYLFDPTNMFFWFITGVIIPPCGVLGDLMESMFKRDVDIKDTSNIMPGHGGILDRFDSTFFVVPFFFTWTIIYFLFNIY